MLNTKEKIMSDCILYVDMDGVLTDFNKHFKDRTGVEKSQAQLDGTYRNWMLNLVETDFFKTLPSSKTLNDGMLGLIQIASSMVQVEILTSYGPWYDPKLKLGDQFGVKTHAAKVDWLNNHNISRYISKFNGVPDCTDKHRFGNKNTFLIDDQVENVDGFKSFGGSGIVYFDTPESYDVTAMSLEDWLRKKGIL